jgi:hypothetical protein
MIKSALKPHSFSLHQVPVFGPDQSGRYTQLVTGPCCDLPQAKIVNFHYRAERAGKAISATQWHNRRARR